MPNAEYPHPCKWCSFKARTNRELKFHFEGWHPVEHWDWLGRIVTEALSLPKEMEDS